MPKTRKPSIRANMAKIFKATSPVKMYNFCQAQFFIEKRCPASRRDYAIEFRAWLLPLT